MPGTLHLQIQKSKYYMHGQELESQDSAKYLGIAGTHTSATLLALSIELRVLIVSVPDYCLSFYFVKRNVKTKINEIKTLVYNSSVRPQVEHASRIGALYKGKHREDRDGPAEG